MDAPLGRACRSSSWGGYLQRPSDAAVGDASQAVDLYLSAAWYLRRAMPASGGATRLGWWHQAGGRSRCCGW